MGYLYLFYLLPFTFTFTVSFIIKLILYGIAYSVFAFLIQFCLPLVATAVLYVRIYARLRLRRRRALSGHLRNSSTAALNPNPFRQCPSLTSEPAIHTEHGRNSTLGIAGNNVASRTTKTNRILAAIVVNFVVCWADKH